MIFLVVSVGNSYAFTDK